MKVDIIELPERRLATVSHQGPYSKISGAFARLGRIAGIAGLIGPSAEMLAVYHDDPNTTPAPELRPEAAITVSPGVKIPDGLGEGSIPAGRYARTTHIGPYEQLVDIWPRFMGEWLPASGHQMRDGASFEIYRNTPGEVPGEKLVTELYIAIA